MRVLQRSNTSKAIGKIASVPRPCKAETTIEGGCPAYSKHNHNKKILKEYNDPYIELIVSLQQQEIALNHFYSIQQIILFLYLKSIHNNNNNKTSILL